MRKVIYIGGPISSPDTIQVFYNLSRFFYWEMRLTEAGFSVINPAADVISLLMGGRLIYDDLLAKDEPLVKRSDTLFLLDRWNTSRGARREKRWATQLLIPHTFERNGIEGVRRALAVAA